MLASAVKGRAGLLMLPEEAGLHTHCHQCCIIAVEDHHVDFVEFVIGERLMGVQFFIPKGDGILLIHCDALLKTRALQRGGPGLRLVQVCTSHQHNLVEGADGLAGGLYPQAVCQIEGLDSIVKCGGAKVGCTGGMGQGVGVDGQLRSILIVDISGEGGLLGIFASSTSLLATMASMASLSLGRSVSAHTAIGCALLLLLGKLGVSWLALHSAKLVGLLAPTTTAMRGTFLLKRERSGLDDPVWFEILDLAQGGLAENLCYNLHSWRELTENNHRLHGGRELEASISQVGEVAEHFGYRGSGMGASRDGCREEPAQLSVSGADAGGAKVLL